MTAFPHELCSDADLAVGDDLRGSAARFDSFVVVEQRGSFGKEAAIDAVRALDPQRAGGLIAEPGLRPFAIRPVGRPESSGVRARFAGRTGPASWLAPSRRCRRARHPRSDRRASAGSPCSRCAPTVLGIAAVRSRAGSWPSCCIAELDDPDAGDDACVVEVSHLGGHRFAPTMLVLPTGYAYGRLDVDTALEVAWAAQDGLVHPANLRGRADLEPAAQVADAHWRSELGAAAPIDAVRITATTGDSADTLVDAEVQGRAERLRLRWEPGPVIQQTLCGGNRSPPDGGQCAHQQAEPTAAEPAGRTAQSPTTRRSTLAPSERRSSRNRG